MKWPKIKSLAFLFHFHFLGHLLSFPSRSHNSRPLYCPLAENSCARKRILDRNMATIWAPHERKDRRSYVCGHAFSVFMVDPSLRFLMGRPWQRISCPVQEWFLKMLAWFLCTGNTMQHLWELILVTGLHFLASNNLGCIFYMWAQIIARKYSSSHSLGQK